MNAETAERIRSLLATEIDWPSLIAASRRHGLMPLLYWHLHSISPDLVPRAVLQELRECFVNNSARNLLLTAELIKILTLFENHGIPALPFKGPVLARSIYGNLAFRQFEDLDILVPENKVAQAEALLRDQGYKATQEIPQARSASFLWTQYEIPYRHEGNSTCVELHWKVAPIFFPCAIDMQGVWNRVEWADLAGKRVRNLSNMDLLLILCAHGGRHLWEKLEWICGVAELVRANPHMNWEWLFKQARDSGSERVLLLGLVMAHDLCGVEIPEEVRGRIREDAPLLDLAALAQSRLFAPDLPPLTAMERCFYQARLADRWPDRIRILTRMIFLPRYHDWICLELPTQLSFLYFPIRIARLLWKSALAPLSKQPIESRNSARLRGEGGPPAPQIVELSPEMPHFMRD